MAALSADCAARARLLCLERRYKRPDHISLGAARSIQAGNKVRALFVCSAKLLHNGGERFPVRNEVVSVTELRLDQRQTLSASWLLRLVREAGFDIPQTSLSTAPFIIGRAADFHIAVTPQDSSPWIRAVSSDESRQEEIGELVQRSGELASGRLESVEDFGGHVWYTCTLAGEQRIWESPCSFHACRRCSTRRSGSWIGGVLVGVCCLISAKIHPRAGRRTRQF
jgi:hypothetical protein